MRAKLFTSLAIGVLGLLVGLWLVRPPATRANGDKHEETGGHAHVPAPLEYADVHVPLSVWTDPAMITRGKEIYAPAARSAMATRATARAPPASRYPSNPPISATRPASRR